MNPSKETANGTGRTTPQTGPHRTGKPRTGTGSARSPEGRRGTHVKRTAGKRKTKKRFPAAVLIAVLLVALCAGCILSVFVKKGGEARPAAGPVYTSELNGKETYFAEPIQRDCPWDAERGAYYDAETDCYFWHYKTKDTAVWQYWYNGISSDYSTFGWMEWREGRWYIQNEEGAWKLLPDEYISDRLWHIDQ